MPSTVPIYHHAKAIYFIDMDIKEIRMMNLQLLIQEAGSAAKLCRRCGTDPAYLSQITTGVMTPAGTTRSIGEELARKLEAGMSKPRGWMDVIHVPTHDPEVLRLAEAIQALSPEARVHLQAVTDAFVKSIAYIPWNGKVDRRKSK